MIISAASDYRAGAQRILPFLFHYIDAGAYAEHTLRRNVADLSRWPSPARAEEYVRPEPETKLFNETLSPCRWPFAPVGLCGMYARRGRSSGRRRR